MIRFLSVAIVATFMGTAASAATYHDFDFKGEKLRTMSQPVFDQLVSKHGMQWQWQVKRFCDGKGKAGCKASLHSFVGQVLKEHGTGGGKSVTEVTPSAVPLPAGGVLLLTAFGGLAALRRYKRRARA
ncbi:MAG: VPLPA-CTERM sorting domain-containing protein [Rhodobacteraceae bacterium]|nr:VPLPA-CTERM sorting domain-containing protein [Paracoccaceae bacterium]